MKKFMMVAIALIAGLVSNAQETFPSITITSSHNPEIVASFPGGKAKFNQWLQRSLSEFTNTEKGSYTIVIALTIDREGNISDICTLFDREIDRFIVNKIKDGPTWNPAIINGRQAISRFKFYINVVL
jgi:hypothetical protein